MSNTRDILRINEADLFLSTIHQEKREGEQIYSINRSRIDQILDLLSCLLESSEYSFYGMSLIPKGLDIIITLRLDCLSGLERYDISDLYEVIESCKLTPLEDQFLIELLIKDFYKINNYPSTL